MKTPHTALPKEHLEAVGRAIYGEAYKAPLARALKVDLRTLQRWVSDACDLAWNHGAIADLRDILAEEHAEVLSNEVALRTALADLDDAVEYRKLCEANGGEESVQFSVDCSHLTGWMPQPPSERRWEAGRRPGGKKAFSRSKGHHRSFLASCGGNLPDHH